MSVWKTREQDLKYFTELMESMNDTGRTRIIDLIKSVDMVPYFFGDNVVNVAERCRKRAKAKKEG